MPVAGRGRRASRVIGEDEFLRALDGKLAGKSHRLIATELYGAAAVAAEWDSGGPVHARVRRRIKRSLHLMREGYRALASGGR